MRVLVLASLRTPSDMLRAVWPAAALRAAGVDVTVTPPGWSIPALVEGRTIHMLETPEVDAVVVLRPQSPLMVDALALWQQRGIAVVVDVDDALGMVDPNNPAFNPAGAAECARACRGADLVTVTTPQLARVYGGHGRVKVIPNYLPRSLLAAAPTVNDPPVIGWCGDVGTHPRDLQVTRGEVDRALRRSGARFRVVGPGDQVTRHLDLTDEPEVTGYVRHDAWYSTVAQLDIGIAPSADTRFNAAKSGLRSLTYAFGGVASVASPTPDNLRLARAGMGWIAAKPDDWFRALHRLALSPEERLEVGSRALLAAQGQCIEHHVDEWADAWDNALTWRAPAKV